MRCATCARSSTANRYTWSRTSGTRTPARGLQVVDHGPWAIRRHVLSGRITPIATGSSSRGWRTMCGIHGGRWQSKEKLRSAIRFHGKTPVVFLSPILRSHVSPPRHGNTSRYGRIVRRYVSRLLPDHLRAVSDAPLEQRPVIPEHLHRHPEFDRHAAGFAVVGSLGELVFTFAAACPGRSAPRTPDTADICAASCS